MLALNQPDTVVSRVNIERILAERVYNELVDLVAFDLLMLDEVVILDMDF